MGMNPEEDYQNERPCNGQVKEHGSMKPQKGVGGQMAAVSELRDGLAWL